MAQNREESQHRAQVRKMTDEEVGVALKELQDKLFTIRSQAVTEKVENVAQFGVVRRSIARLLTERNARRAKASPAKPAKAKAEKAPSGKKPAAKGAKAPKAGGAKKAGGSKPASKTKAAAKAG